MFQPVLAPRYEDVGIRLYLFFSSALNGNKCKAFRFLPLPLRGDRGGTVVKVLCYKSEGRWFDPRWCHWNFSLT